MERHISNLADKVNILPNIAWRWEKVMWKVDWKKLGAYWKVEHCECRSVQNEQRARIIKYKVHKPARIFVVRKSRKGRNFTSRNKFSWKTSSESIKNQGFDKGPRDI